MTDECSIEVETTQVGTKSFTLSYKVIVNKDSNVIIKTIGESTLVCYNFFKKETIILPEKLKAVLLKHTAA